MQQITHFLDPWSTIVYLYEWHRFMVFMQVDCMQSHMSSYGNMFRFHWFSLPFSEGFFFRRASEDQLPSPAFLEDKKSCRLAVSLASASGGVLKPPKKIATIFVLRKMTWATINANHETKGAHVCIVCFQDMLRQSCSMLTLQTVRDITQKYKDVPTAFRG